MNNRSLKTKMERELRPLTGQLNTWGGKKKGNMPGSELWEHMAQDGRSNESYQCGLKETQTRGKLSLSLFTGSMVRSRCLNRGETKAGVKLHPHMCVFFFFL